MGQSRSEESPGESPRGSGVATPERPPERTPEPPPAPDAQTQADDARAQYEADLQQRQEEAFQRERQSPVIGAETRRYVPPANATMTRAGPMTMRFAVEGLQIFQRYGKRYQVVQTVQGGVLAVDLEYSQPKPVVFMAAPDGGELEQAPEK